MSDFTQPELAPPLAPELPEKLALSTPTMDGSDKTSALDPTTAAPPIEDASASAPPPDTGAEDTENTPLLADPQDTPASFSELADAKLTAPLPPTSKPDVDLPTQAIQFFATAEPNVLIGVVAGLAVTVYIVFGRIGLVLIGAVSGVILFISYEGKTPQQARATRAEVGAEIMKRLLGAREAATTTEADDQAEEDAVIASFDDFQPETRKALTELIDATLQDFVKYWYTPLVPSDRSFPLSVRRALTNYILSISNHLARKRPADMFLDFVTNSVSMLIVFLSELSLAYSNVPDGQANAADTVYDYLAENPESNLANLLNQRQQAVKLKTIAEDLLTYLDKSIFECDITRVFLREIFSSVILEKTLLSCSRPEWINGWIVYMLEAGEPDFNQAIDVGMQTGPEAAKKEKELKAKEEEKKKQQKLKEEQEAAATAAADAEAEKKAAKAADAMREAMEEMERMNRMIAQAESENKPQDGETSTSSQPGSVANSKTYSLLDGEDSHSSDAVNTPQTPRSPPTDSPRADAESTNEASITEIRPFTSFDQMMPVMTDPLPDSGSGEKAPLTLHNATITVHDDDTDNTWKLLGKPNWEYLVQVEPTSSTYPGWMVVRKYSDFESLHEILRRIASVSGAAAFVDQHSTLPSWKNHTRSSLRTVLEVYLRDACWFQSLAESEGMKRFLDKDKGMPKVPEKSLFNWNGMGGVLDAVADAPKGAFQGSKAVVGGLFGSIGNLGKRASQQQQPQQMPTPAPESSVTPAQTPRKSLTLSPTSGTGTPRDLTSSPAFGAMSRTSMDSTRSSVISVQPGRIPPMERRPSHQALSSPIGVDGDDRRSHYERWEQVSSTGRASREHSRASSMVGLRSPRSPSVGSSVFATEGLKLPPRPDEMDEKAEDSLLGVSGRRRDRGDTVSAVSENTRTVLGRSGTFGADDQEAMIPAVTGAVAEIEQTETTTTEPVEEEKVSEKKTPRHSPLSESEARVAIELVFAVINELYTLSSAWNIRRTLLTAAKSFLLRPGNPSLLAIQDMMQTSVLDANTDDAGLASYLGKIRESAMPTPEELAQWPAELTADEKEALRIKARRLFIKSGVPEALKGVMGEKASADALGRLFDCLQMEEVARGLIFGILLQAVQIVTR